MQSSKYSKTKMKILILKSEFRSAMTPLKNSHFEVQAAEQLNYVFKW